MFYNQFIEYLIDQGCGKIPEGSSDEGDYFRNCLNGELCFVDKVDRFSIPTLCHIICELGIAPPYEFEDDYEIYKTFRTERLKIKINKENI